MKKASLTHHILELGGDGVGTPSRGVVLDERGLEPSTHIARCLWKVLFHEKWNSTRKDYKKREKWKSHSVYTCDSVSVTAGSGPARW